MLAQYIVLSIIFACVMVLFLYLVSRVSSTYNADIQRFKGLERAAERDIARIEQRMAQRKKESA